MGWIEEVPRHKIKMVESIRLIPREERIKRIKEAGYNVFLLKSRDVFIDLLSDSGTNAMSDAQWSAMFNADEAYSGAESFYRMEKSIQEITGLKYVLPVHQGRAAENVLDTALVKEGDCIPGNIHFDTTKAHIEYRKATGTDCAVGEAFDCEKECQFKGNIDLKKLEGVIKKHGAEKIPYVLLTVTCNSGGG
ncbi:MAG: beta-eliminating lyase-related protein, partial [archaeon]